VSPAIFVINSDLFIGPSEANDVRAAWCADARAQFLGVRSGYTLASEESQ
jgi:hypothetical protein